MQYQEHPPLIMSDSKFEEVLNSLNIVTLILMTARRYAGIYRIVQSE